MSFEPFNWQCPTCGLRQVVTENSYGEANSGLGTFQGKFKNPAIFVRSIACANPSCKELAVTATLYEREWSGNDLAYKCDIDVATLRPEPAGKPQPDYIPQPITQDYKEACRILLLSPKASATLARRCLQGMIRDFCGIALGTLDAEIKELRKRVEAEKAPRGVTGESVDAIDHARKVGNVGAHMERDVNLIVDVDPDEAAILIDLIELLFREWYVEREDRRNRLAGIKAAADRIGELKQQVRHRFN